MNTEKTKRDQYELAMLNLIGLNALFLVMLFIVSCMSCDLQIIEYVGMIIPLLIALIPYIVLDAMICKVNKTAKQKLIILVGAIIISILGGSIYLLNFAYPDAQSGLVFFSVPVMQLIACSLLTLATNFVKK